TGWCGSARSGGDWIPTGCSRTTRRGGWGSSDAASVGLIAGPAYDEFPVGGVTRPGLGCSGRGVFNAARQVRSQAARFRDSFEEVAMRRTAAGLALVLSASLSVVAQADPGRSPHDDTPPVGQPAAPKTAALNPVWRHLSPDPWPRSRMSAYAVLDPSLDRMVVFGGWGFGMFSDTWQLDL